MKNKHNPEKVSVNNQNDNLYNLNSFRGSKIEKNNLARDLKVQAGNHSSRNMFSSEEKNKNKEKEQEKKKYKPRILTGKLPMAFDISSKGKKESPKINLNMVNEDDSPKKLIKRFDEVDLFYNNKICLTEGQGTLDTLDKGKIVMPKISVIIFKLRKLGLWDE